MNYYDEPTKHSIFISYVHEDFQQVNGFIGIRNFDNDLAWKIYVQLTTRKAALEIDENEDSIEDIYNSWYELFTTTRKYLTEMPAIELRGNANAKKIVNLAIDVLNKGLRPHLTKWQKKYKKWCNQISDM